MRGRCRNKGLKRPVSSHGLGREVDQRDPPNSLGAGGVTAGLAGDVVDAGEPADQERTFGDTTRKGLLPKVKQMQYGGKRTWGLNVGC